VADDPRTKSKVDSVVIDSGSSDAITQELSTATAPSSLTEDGALALLQNTDVDRETLEQLGRTELVAKSRKVKCALVAHPRSPRHVSVPLLRQLYTFDLMHLALTPVVAGDLKRAADEVLCNRLASIVPGERLSLARRGSGRVAAALLHDREARVMRAALENTHLTEALIVQAITRAVSNAPLIEALCHHAQWSLRREVRITLLRNEKTPMARAVEFARGIPAPQLREILQNSKLPENIKSFLLRELSQKHQGAGAP